MQDIQQLSLVFMQSFYLNIEDGIRVHVDAFCFFDIVCQSDLVISLDRHETFTEGCIICIRDQFLQLIQICNPILTDFFTDQVSQFSVGVYQPSSLGDPVCFIVEFFRIQFIEISQFLIFQNFCMQRSYAVYGMAAYDGQISHADLTVSDDRHFSYLRRVIAVFFCQFQNETTVDFFHDLIDTRQQTAEQFHGPFFQCFRHDGMVCVSTYFSCDIPSLFPRHIVFIHQHTHQFCNCHTGVGIIQLECNLFRQLIEICVHFFETGDHSLDRCGNKEILLTQTQFFALHVFIGRIEYVGQGVCQHFFFCCFLIVPFVEGLQIQSILGFCFPQTQCVYGVVTIADDRIVIGDGCNGLEVFMYHFVAAFVVSHCAYIAAEFYFYGIFISLDAPGIAVFQPVIGCFHLIAVFDTLFENAVVVADTAAICRQRQCRQGFQEAGSQTAQTTVPQTGVGFCVFYHVIIDAQLFKYCFYIIEHFQIDESIAEEATHQKFHRQVINYFYVFFIIFIMGLHPFISDDIPDSKYCRLIQLFRCGMFQCFSVQRFYVFPNHFFQLFFLDKTHNNPLGYQR